MNSTDLQVVVNALWRAGAEAIAVNQQRLTTTSAIRFAGEAILVNYRPLDPPYQIAVIGNSAEVQAAFARGDGASYLKTLESTYGVTWSVATSDHLTLDAAVGLNPRYAKPAPSGPASAPSSSTNSDRSFLERSP